MIPSLPPRVNARPQTTDYLSFDIWAITYLTHHFVFSPRSGRQRKAWGVSPRSGTRMSIEPATRVTALALNILQMIRLPPASQALIAFTDVILGLMPQAGVPGR